MLGQCDQAVQRTDQHFDMAHPAVRVDCDPVNALQLRLADLRLEFENDLVAVDPFLRVGEVLETGDDRGQNGDHIILRGLRLVEGGGGDRRAVGDNGLQQRRIVVLDIGVPAGQKGLGGIAHLQAPVRCVYNGVID